MRALTIGSLLMVMLAATELKAEPRCMFRRAVGVDFGAFNPFAPTPLRAAGTISYRCNGNRDRVLQIEVSSGSSDSFAVRQMRNGPRVLAYNLFLDAATTVVWGDGSPGTSVHGPVSPPPNTEIDVPIYGVIPSRQSVAAGSYADSVVVTLVF